LTSGIITNMYLKKLKLINFKNYLQADFDFSKGINCFTGNNGSGKTNVLDAIYYLSFCKSYFTSLDHQNINHDKDFFGIHGFYLKNNHGEDKISCVQENGKKKIFRLNDDEYKRLADHIGEFPLVMVSPYDRDLINEGSDVRRKFLDSVISQFDRPYLNDLISYNRSLKQRNALLKSFALERYFDKDTLDVWNKKLVIGNQKIYEKREKFIKDFIPYFQEYFESISGGREKVSLRYESQLHDSNSENLFEESIDKDLQLRYTSTGIHKDDMQMLIDDYSVKKFGSQGQQKSFVIAMKLAQFEYIRQVKKFFPILLLDDIFDKLDHHRVKHIIKLVSDHKFGQVFITDTQRERVEDIFKTVEIDHKIFEIANGEKVQEDDY